MKRRSFLQSIGAAVAALFVPAAAAKQTAPAAPGYLTDPDVWCLMDKPGGLKVLWVYPGDIRKARKLLGPDAWIYDNLNDAITSANPNSTIRVWPAQS